MSTPPTPPPDPGRWGSGSMAARPLPPRWALRRLLLLLWLGLAGLARACLLCSPASKELLDDLLLDYLPGHARGAELEEGARYVRKLIADYNRFSLMAQLVLDKSTIDLKREITNIVKQKLKGHFLSSALLSFSVHARETVNRHISHFSNHVECSNICGNFTVKFRHCSDCSTEYVSCVMKIECAVLKLKVGINDEIRLDCFEPWHRITSNFHSYIYFRAPLGSRNLWNFQEMRETDESSLSILQVKKEHEQTYRCIVMGNEGKPIADSFYDVTVGERIAIPTETGETHPPLFQEEGLEPEVTTPTPRPNSLLVLNLVSLLAIVILAVTLVSLVGYTCHSRMRRREPEDDKLREMMQFIS